MQVSGSVDFEILRGLTNSLLAGKKPDEVVQNAELIKFEMMI